MDLMKYKSFHFIGIGGMGMRALAEILLEKGLSISGSDLADSPAIENFKARGASIFIGHAPSNVKGAGCVIISSAISSNNPELVEARRENIPVFHRSDVLAALLEEGKGISVAGAHGKSTTSAMVGQIFSEAGEDPTIVLGAAADYIHGNSILGKGDYVIAEADESDGSFLKFHNFIAIVTNVEDDHLDHYKTVENIRKAFTDFVNHITFAEGAAFMCLDSDGVRAILPGIHSKVITYGLDDKADYRAVNIHYVNRLLYYDILHEGKKLGTICLHVPGLHNVRNSLGALAAASYCGIPFDVSARAISHFKGAKRRFETKFHNEDLWIVDDYAHHPTEIKATLRAAKETGVKRIICAFQPHRYSRTLLLKDEFAEAFDDADVLFFTDIYAASEVPIPGVDGHTIPDVVRNRLPEKEIHYIPNVQDMSDALYDCLKAGDMVITMGAGSIFKSGEALAHLMKEKGMEK